MARVTTPGTAVERLAHDLFDGDIDAAMAREMVGWLAGSARFRAFAEAHRDKIRKKLRGAADDESRRDVRAELAVAQLLLADRRIELAFEAYGSTKGGPDFTVTFRRGHRFNLEVTRLRGALGMATIGAAIVAKVRQLPPSVPNAVLVAADDGTGADPDDVAAAARALRARADAKEEAFFATRGLDGSRGFYQRFLRLGAVLVWCEEAVGHARAAGWINPSARIALPEPAVRACLLALRDQSSRSTMANPSSLPGQRARR
jgi:hypothetical protein